jgi:hypothetical protein
VSIKHAFTSQYADSADKTLVKPSDWNADHVGTALDLEVNGTQNASQNLLNLTGVTGAVVTDAGNGTVQVGVGSITESQVTGLTADLAAKAPLASPALTGTPTAPTATAGTNSTQLATTAFVQASMAAAGTVTSVGLSAPPEFVVSGSPVTSSGTLALSKSPEPSNTVWAGPAFFEEAARLVQQAVISACSGAGSVAAAFQDNVTAGNLLLFVANFSGAPGAVTDTLGNTWLTAISNVHTAIYYCIAKGSGADTIQFASSCAATGGYQVVSAYEFSGIIASPLDQIGTSTGSGPASSISVSTAGAVVLGTELVIGVFATDSGKPAFTEGVGSTLLQQYSASGQSQAITQLDVTYGLTGIQTLSVAVKPNVPGSGNWYGAIATFKASGSGQGTPSFRPLISEDIPTSLVLTGAPTAPTPATGDNSTSIATTAFVQSSTASGPAVWTTGANYAAGQLVYYDNLRFQVVTAITNAPATPDFTTITPYGYGLADYGSGTVSIAVGGKGQWMLLATVPSYGTYRVWLDGYMANADASSILDVTTSYANATMTLLKAANPTSQLFEAFRLSSATGTNDPVRVEGQLGTDGQSLSYKIFVSGQQQGNASGSITVPKPFTYQSANQGGTQFALLPINANTTLTTGALSVNGTGQFTGTISAADKITLSGPNSSLTSPTLIDMSGSQAGQINVPDPDNGIRCGSGQEFQLYSYWALHLYGMHEAGPPAFVPANSNTAAVTIESPAGGSGPALQVNGAATIGTTSQTGNILQVNSAGGSNNLSLVLTSPANQWKIWQGAAANALSFYSNAASTNTLVLDGSGTSPAVSANASNAAPALTANGNPWAAQTNGMLDLAGNTSITSAPPSGSSNAGWKATLWGNSYAIGNAAYTFAIRTGWYLSVFGTTPPANNGNSSTPDSSSVASISINGVYYSGASAGVTAGPFASITSITTTGGIVTGLTGSSTEPANTVWAGPTTGAAAAPTFRALVSGDIPVPLTLNVPTPSSGQTVDWVDLTYGGQAPIWSLSTYQTNNDLLFRSGGVNYLEFASYGQSVQFNPNIPVTGRTPPVGDNSNNFATTAFVVTSFAPLASPALTGTPTAPTATLGTNTTQIATTAFVDLAYRLNRVLMITASGTYTPTVGARALYVECVGGGGEGGQATATTANASVGGGGGAGGYSASWLTSILASYSVTVGAGGSGAAVAAAGNAGGDTIFGSNVVVAHGGAGGGAGTAAGTVAAISQGGAGGAVGVGDYSTAGNRGGWGVVVSGSLVCAGGGAPGYFGGSPHPGDWATSGGGGTGAGAANSGAGGGGAYFIGTGAGTTATGSGGSGVVRIWEFI